MLQLLQLPFPHSVTCSSLQDWKLKRQRTSHQMEQQGDGGMQLTHKSRNQMLWIYITDLTDTSIPSASTLQHMEITPSQLFPYQLKPWMLAAIDHVLSCVYTSISSIVIISADPTGTHSTGQEISSRKDYWLILFCSNCPKTKWYLLDRKALIDTKI